ncbi:unnamed protein product [Durusdinium trenchii]|uniref:Uncharacterized protein n=1 Tax=Durusdinium trenchii TaxID=1381693 RepID=A0ABP0HUN6_9DINO
MIQSLPPKFFDCCIHFDMAQAPRCVSLHSGLGYERGDMCNAIANVSDDAVFKFAQMEVQGFLGRHWLGRTLVAAVPCPRQELLTSRKMMGEIRRGSGAEAAISTGIKVADVRDGLQNGPFNWKGLVVQALPPEMKQEAEAVGQPSHRSTEAAPYAEALGCAVVKAAASKHWGVAKALLQELSWSSEPARQKALAKARGGEFEEVGERAEADATRKTALRMCVDGLARDSKQLLQAWFS